MSECPCGSKKNYTVCCGCYIDGEAAAPSPEALMRSRYTAFTQANVDYIEKTMMGPAAKNFHKVDTKNWAQEVNWLGLEVINVSPLEKEGRVGFVEFNAHFEYQGRPENIHERSEFRCKKGRWYYYQGRR